MDEIGIAYKRYKNDAYKFVKEMIGPKEITKQQELVLKALAKHTQIAVKSGHGVGKSALSAWITLWFMFTRPMCKVALTAPTQHQLEDILWSELKKWANGCDELYELFEIRKTRMVVRDSRYEETWFAVPISVRKPENLQGFHADDMLFIVDEASGVPSAVFEAVEGALTNKGAYLIMFGNPTQTSGVFYDAFHKQAKQYKTFTFSSEESPLVSIEYIRRMREKFGADSNVYRVRVLGEFPSGTLDSVIPMSWIEGSFNNDMNDKVSGEVCFGVDVARYGDDETVIAITSGNVVEEILRYRNLDTVEVSDELERLVYKWNPDKVKIELAATGAGVFDIFKRKHLPCKRVGFIPSGEPCNKVYADAMTEAWFNLRERFKSTIQGRSGLVMVDNIDALEQLSSRSYVIQPNGKYKLEEKGQHKRKNRGVSPDIGDALAIAFYEGKKGTLAQMGSDKNYIMRGESEWGAFRRVKW